GGDGPGPARRGARPARGGGRPPPAGLRDSSARRFLEDGADRARDFSGSRARWRDARSGFARPFRSHATTIESVPRVESGLEVLVRRRPALLRGQRVALLTHQASVDSRFEHAVSLVRDLRGVTLRRLLAPEHGLRGAPQDHIWIV